jgi:hypothetical protein
MPERVLLKLGGSVITDKGADCAVSHERLAAVACDIAGIPTPQTGLEGKFSLAFCVALALGEAGADVIVHGRSSNQSRIPGSSRPYSSGTQVIRPASSRAWSFQAWSP